MSRSLVSRSFVRQIVRSAANAAIGAACVATMLLAANAAHAQGLYQPPAVAPTLPTGTTPQGVAAADFALSGYQSLVATDNGSNNMKVYLATGAGTFASANTYKTCKGPTAVLTGDANQDGYPDIAVACPSSNTIDLFLNNGASGPGTFPTFPSFTFSATDPVAMVTGDFLGNGLLDLAAASGTGGITVILDIGGSAVTSFISASGTFSGITTGDYNHDGNLDLAVSDSSDNNVQVFFGDGTGDFTASGTYSVGTAPSGIATADFNKDGNLDLATTNAGSNNVSVLLGSPAGTFTVQANPQSAGLNPIAISVTDVNSDGYPDVIAYDAQNVSSTGENAYVVLLGNGDGTLQPPQISSLSDMPGTVPTVADFNRDGKPDLAITQQTADEIALLINNTLPTPYPSGRSFSSATTITSGNGNMADSIATGDFNRDGRLDVAVSYLEDNAVRVLLNNGSGGFNLSGTYPVGPQPYYVASADLNGDGFPDLVVVNSSVNSATGTISVLMNNGASGNGTFAAAVSYPVGRLPYQVAIGDVNGDGYPDLAVTNYGANTVSIFYGSKSGTFTAGPTLSTGSEPYGVVIGDFQHDGYPDIAVTCFGVDMLYVFPNNGDGSFGAAYTYATGAGPMSLVTGDFNRDGLLDIVVANATGGPAGDTNPVTSGNNISFFAGNGDSTFQAGVIGPSLNFPQSIAAGDVNGDGILDIVGVAPNYNAVEVTLGVGDGTFGTFDQRAQGQFSAAKQPWAVALGDFYNDGQLDIVTANTYNQVNITIPAYQNRYMTEYPPVAHGEPSVDLLSNLSAAAISLSVTPSGTIPADNSGVTITATVQPALSGPTPTGSVIFENAAGAPLGSGPYALSAYGTASYSTGPLASGQYVFPTLYSGDTLFQPTTASGLTVTVAGTPVTLTINPSSVPYDGTFTATVTVTGTPANGTPTGTVTIYGNPGDFTLTPITLVNGSGSGTFTADNPDFSAGTYQLYASYTPANGSPYQPGTSSDVTLTVTPLATTTTLSCLYEPVGTECTATVTVTATEAPVTAGNIVDFSVSGVSGVTPETTNASGQAIFSYVQETGTFTITAAFLQQGDYSASSGSTPAGCSDYSCAIRRSPVGPLNSFNGLEFGNSAAPVANNNRGRNTGKNVPFPFF